MERFLDRLSPGKRFLANLAGFALLLAAAAFLFGPAPSHAQVQQVQRQDNTRSFANLYTTATQTFATTTPTLVTGDTQAAQTVNDPSELIFQNSSVYVPERIRVWWSADVAKATATTGSCQVYFNGVAVARSLRTVSYAGGETTIGGFVDISYPTDSWNTGSGTQVQTVALYCFSADTNVFSVYRTNLFAQEVY